MSAEEIRSRREAAGMSPEELAAELGVSVRTLYRMEIGEKIPTKAERIALAVIFSEQAGAKSVSVAARKSITR